MIEAQDLTKVYGGKAAVLCIWTVLAVAAYLLDRRDA
jgi:hypothetical protein